MTIIDMVAEQKGVEPLELTPLHDTIDTDAVDSLVAAANSGDAREDVWVEFTYAGHTIAVDGGEIAILHE